MKTRPTFNTRKQSLAALAATLLVIAACSSEADAEADADAGPAAVQDTGDSQDDGDSDNSEAEQVDDSDDDSADPGPDTVAMTAEDGWTELHDLPIPDRGMATIAMEGEELTVEVVCRGPGVYTVEDPPDQFFVHVSSDFEMSDGRPANFYIDKKVEHVGEESSHAYEGLAHVSASFAIELSTGSNHVAFISSPSADDRTGSALPCYTSNLTAALPFSTVLSPIPGRPKLPPARSPLPANARHLGLILSDTNPPQPAMPQTLVPTIDCMNFSRYSMT